jgi:hypothetical protein
MHVRSIFVQFGVERSAKQLRLDYVLMYEQADICGGQVVRDVLGYILKPSYKNIKQNCGLKRKRNSRGSALM